MYLKHSKPDPVKVGKILQALREADKARLNSMPPAMPAPASKSLPQLSQPAARWSFSTDELLELTDSDLTIMEMLDEMESRGMDPMARLPALPLTSKTKG